MRLAPLDPKAGREGIQIRRIYDSKSIHQHLCLQAEAQRFTAALQRRAAQQASSEFEVSELFDVADAIELAVPDLTAFIDQLNEAGQSFSEGSA